MIKAKLGIKTKKGKYSILIGSNFLSRLSKIFQKNRIIFFWNFVKIQFGARIRTRYEKLHPGHMVSRF